MLVYVQSIIAIGIGIISAITDFKKNYSEEDLEEEEK